MLYEFLLEKDKQLAYSLGKNIMKNKYYSHEFAKDRSK